MVITSQLSPFKFLFNIFTYSFQSNSEEEIVHFHKIDQADDTCYFILYKEHEKN